MSGDSQLGVVEQFNAIRVSAERQLQEDTRQIILTNPAIFSDFDDYAALYGIGRDTDGNAISKPVEYRSLDDFQFELQRLVELVVLNSPNQSSVLIADFLEFAYGIEKRDVTDAVASLGYGGESKVTFGIFSGNLIPK